MLDDPASKHEDVDAGVAATGRCYTGMARGAFAVSVPQGWSQGTRPASNSPLIVVVI